MFAIDGRYIVYSMLGMLFCVVALDVSTKKLLKDRYDLNNPTVAIPAFHGTNPQADSQVVANPTHGNVACLCLPLWQTEDGVDTCHTMA